MAKQNQGGSKGRKSNNANSKARRRASWLRCNVGSLKVPAKKDRNVARSSHGAFADRLALEKHDGQKHTKADKG